MVAQHSTVCLLKGHTTITVGKDNKMLMPLEARRCFFALLTIVVACTVTITISTLDGRRAHCSPAEKPDGQAGEGNRATNDFSTIEGNLRSSRQSAKWGTDPQSGAHVVRLTSSPGRGHNIYCEQPYGSPDGQRIVFYQSGSPTWGPHKLVIAELSGLYTLTEIEPELKSLSIAHSSWGEWAYYSMEDGSIRRVSLLTLQRQAVLPAGSIDTSRQGFRSITPDNRWIIGTEWVKGAEADGSPLKRCYALDTRTGQQRVILQDPDNRNSHAQSELGNGGRWMYQLLVSPGRVPVFVRELFGSADPVQLPFGGQWSAESTGHMAWIGTTGRVACAVQWDREARQHVPRHPDGNLLIAAPGDTKPQVFAAPEHGFYHVSISRCGRYFVCDDWMDYEPTGILDAKPGPIRIVIGNLKTGKYRVLIHDCQCYGLGSTAAFEPNPYMTADNRWVIYNGSPFGSTQVFAAKLREDFLSSLD
ncbi:MAG: hypothetical protein CMJ81_22490 [Planctomycetaceae bacterium]|nr:hypothetical protein [Planctomycetaceae bacterium]MBP63155.1 hypothetical protein [Planctomycetaceae bacterium]